MMIDQLPFLYYVVFHHCHRHSNFFLLLHPCRDVCEVACVQLAIVTAELGRPPAPWEVDASGSIEGVRGDLNRSTANARGRRGRKGQLRKPRRGVRGAVEVSMTQPMPISEHRRKNQL